MFGSWLLGFIGTLLGILGGIGTLGGILLGAGNHGWGLLAIAILVLALGSFLKYLSKQTVRVKP